MLFLDELPEFPRSVLEVLREPMESGTISISRANAQVEYPAKFQLVAAMNPCPCGYYGDRKGRCRCTPSQVDRYRNKISGPLLDRFDMHIQVNPMPIDELQNRPRGESSAEVRTRVVASRQQQLARQGKANALLAGKELEQHCKLAPEQRKLMASAMDRLHLSARAYDRTLRVARTLADMATSIDIQMQHLSEALGYRSLDQGR